MSLPTARGWAHALRGVSWRMERGQTGESGSGKSLTALALMGLLPERARVSGSITFKGQELVGLPEPQLCQLRGARKAMIFHTDDGTQPFAPHLEADRRALASAPEHERK